MGDKYPYQTFYNVNEGIMSRDNYTCQICGYCGLMERQETVTGCLECERKGIDFQPFPDWTIPKPCRENGLKFRVCRECPQFKETSVKRVYVESLTVHHKDGDKTNQSPENLASVCTSCHRRLHPRGKTLTIDEVKENLKKRETVKKR